MQMQLFITIAKLESDANEVVIMDTSYGGLFNTLDAVHGITEVVAPDGKVWEMDSEDVLYDLLSHITFDEIGEDCKEVHLQAFNDDRTVKVYVR